MEKELPVRKNIRLKGYDYSKKGCYFLTICVKDKHEMLGRIDVGDGVLDVPLVKLSEYGEIAKKHIKEIVEHYKHISIQKYVIMPNHIHILLRISNNNDGTSNINDGTSMTPSPTNAVVPSFVSTFKRFVHKDCGFSFFQRTYHDRIIRDEEDYQAKWNYMENNPIKWAEDEFYTI